MKQFQQIRIDKPRYKKMDGLKYISVMVRDGYTLWADSNGKNRHWVKNKENHAPKG